MVDGGINTRAPRRRCANLNGVSLAVAILALMVPTGCASGESDGLSAPGYSMPEMGEEVSVGQTVSGNYLAGRHAQMTHDAEAASTYLGIALAMDPENASLMGRTFFALAADGRIDQAAQLAVPLVQENPTTLVPNILLSLRDMQADNFKQAAERLGKVPEQGFGAFLIPLVKAWAEAGDGNGVAARNTLKALSERKGFEIFGLVHKALISDFLGETEEARNAYKAAQNKQKDTSFRFVSMYGSFLERSGDREGAAILYGDYLKTNPGVNGIMEILDRFQKSEPAAPTLTSAVIGVSEALFDLASMLGQQRAGDTGLILARLSIDLRPDFDEAKILASEILEDMSRFEQANALYETIEPENRFWRTVQMRIANNLDDLGLMEEAAARLRTLADTYATDADPLLELGRLYHRHEHYGKAVAVYDEAFERIGEPQPHQWRLLYYRGMSMERAGMWKRAEADFLKALEFKPDDASILNYLGYSWVDQGMHLKRAEEMIKKAVELRPTDGYIVDSLGWVYYRFGNFEDAVVELERAVELRPQDPVINDHLGDAYWRVGRRQEARFQWRRSLSFDPPEETRIETERKLREGMKPAKSEGPANEG